MTSDNKWVIVAIGFAVCFYLGWYFPILWLLFIVAVLFVLLTPTKKKTLPPSVPVTVSQPYESYASNDSLEEIKKALQEKLKNAKNDDVREGLNQALAVIGQHHVAQAAPVVAQSQVIAQVPVAPAAAPSKPIDQTLVLLYIGAFLLFGGMSLFAAYADFGNATRLTTLAIMAAIFYVGGLYLYRAKENLKPAGVTFVSVGLLLMPLVGMVAAYLTDLPNAIIWVTTSVIALPLYLMALYVTRAQVVGYLAFLMWLSLAESAVNLFDAPLYIFVWVAIAIGILTQLLLAKVTNSPVEVREPLRWSSMVTVPVAVLANILGLGNGFAEWQLGVSLLLAGLYYATCAFTAKLADKDRDTYFVVSHITAVLGALLVIDDLYVNNASDFGFVLLLVGLLHLAVWFVRQKKIGHLPQYEQTLYVMASVVAFVATA
jgi:hypothetical protein